LIAERERDFYYGKLRDIELILQRSTCEGGSFSLEDRVR
jgi:hypothetical protein